MNEILTAERRDALIDKFTRTAQADVLTNADAIAIISILEEACRRESANLEEAMLRALIEGEDTTKGAEE